MVFFFMTCSATIAIAQTHSIPYWDSDFFVAGDYEYYAFEFQEGTTYRIILKVPSDSDFDLYLYDKNFHLLEERDSSQEGFDERISYTAEYTGIHWVLVDCYSGWGTYELTVEEHTGSCLGTLLVAIFSITACVSYSAVHSRRKKNT